MTIEHDIAEAFEAHTIVKLNPQASNFHTSIKKPRPCSPWLWINDQTIVARASVGIILPLDLIVFVNPQSSLAFRDTLPYPSRHDERETFAQVFSTPLGVSRFQQAFRNWVSTIIFAETLPSTRYIPDSMYSWFDRLYAFLLPTDITTSPVTAETDVSSTPRDEVVQVFRYAFDFIQHTSNLAKTSPERFYLAWYNYPNPIEHIPVAISPQQMPTNPYGPTMPPTLVPASVDNSHHNTRTYGPRQRSTGGPDYPTGLNHDYGQYIHWVHSATGHHRSNAHIKTPNANIESEFDSSTVSAHSSIGQPCGRWNYGTCPYPCSEQRQHVCLLCGHEHPAVYCRRRDNWRTVEIAGE